jgi:hypothetical protein
VRRGRRFQLLRRARGKVSRDRCELVMSSSWELSLALMFSNTQAAEFICFKSNFLFWAASNEFAQRRQACPAPPLAHDSPAA